MRGCVQRVSRAKVEVDSRVVGEIGMGLAVLLGVGKGDTEADAKYLAEKITQLRIFPDADGKMNRSLLDVSGQLLAISQFTLYGDVRKGRRPSFIQAAAPEIGNRLYEYFVEQVRDSGVVVSTGQFQADMQVELVNDGPVTIILDSEKTI
ncbi:MAG: D-aminoacyl-tRNA deacylase [Pirellulaceae bacterium]|nr:D-aminoacyl-tRNA deacylase [Pirellulaceae bacterium]